MIIGIMIRCQVGRLTNGSNKTSAKHARQKTSAAPRVSRGQPSSRVVCVKNPLLLHKTAANTTSAIPDVVGWGTLADGVISASSRWELPDVGCECFATSFKVVSDRSKLEAKFQFCTNESAFAKGDVSLTEPRKSSGECRETGGLAPCRYRINLEDFRRIA